MRVKIISYGYKYYEGEGKAAPEHDFLFSLRDLANPYWVPELKEFCGLDLEIIEFFEQDPGSQKRLEKVTDLVNDFVEDFMANPNRQPEDTLTFAFRCTGGKHRSVYFAEESFKRIQANHNDKLSGVELEHIDLPRYQRV